MKRQVALVAAVAAISCFSPVSDVISDAGADAGATGGNGGGGGASGTGGGNGMVDAGSFPTGGGINTTGGGTAGTGGGLGNTGGGGGGFGGGNCSASNCAGCCAFGFCVSLTNQSRFACGANGAMCAPCSGTAQCIAGVCETNSNVDAGEPSPIGGPCGDTQFCAESTMCLPGATGLGSTGYTDGYCTSNCISSACPAESVCVVTTVAAISTYNCMAVCTPPHAQATCRDGYVCHPPADGGVTEGYCRPNCNNGGLAACPLGKSCESTTGVCH